MHNKQPIKKTRSEMKTEIHLAAKSLRIRSVAALLALCCSVDSVFSQASSTLVTFESGDLPIILSAPHGGRDSIPGAPERKGVGVDLFRSQMDSNTDKLARALADAIEKKLDKRPFTVIAHFHRKYVDANRPSRLAYESDNAKNAYDTYHHALANARDEVIGRWGRGILLDLHGQRAAPNAIFRGTQNGQTAKHLTNRFGPQSLTGKHSIYGQLARQGITILPPLDSTKREDPSYDGGYIVVNYGSSKRGTLDAIQLELGKGLRSADAIESTATRLANAVASFSRAYLPEADQIAGPRRMPRLTTTALNSDPASKRNFVFADDFADGNRAGWFTIDDDVSTLAVNSQSGQLGRLPELSFTASGDSAPKAIVTHFPQVALEKDGDSVTLQFDARHNDVNFGNRGFRFGLFDSCGTQIESDGDLDLEAASLDDKGYFVLLDLGRSTKNDSAVIRESNNATDERLWNGKTVALDDNDDARDPLMFMRDKNYTYTLTLTRRGDRRVDITLENNVTGRDRALAGTSSLTPTFALDTIYFGTSGTDAEFAIDNVVVARNSPDDPARQQVVRDQNGKEAVLVGVYVDTGAGPSVNDLLYALGKFEDVSVMRLTADDIRSGVLADLDLVIHPGGSGGGQGRHLGSKGRTQIREFVADGGGFIGICAGAYLASADYTWSLNLLDAKVVDRKHWARGKGMVDIGLTRIGQELLRSQRTQIPIFYGQGPLLAPGNRPDIEDYEAIAIFDTEIAKNGAPQGVMKGTTAVARGTYGRGRVICFSPHPEMTQGLESFVEFAIDHVKRQRDPQVVEP